MALILPGQTWMVSLASCQRHDGRPIVLTVCLLALALVGVIASVSAAASPSNVTRIVDGDTIYVLINGQTEKVRYIGVDTPETRHPTKGAQPGGREATEINRRLVSGKVVRLDFDVQGRDRYGRLLAYVWIGDMMINAELVRLGYAQVMTIPPNVKHASLFLKLQREAREAGRGLWRRP